MLGRMSLSPSPPRKASICLAMIVKNEAHVIERCLASVRPLLSHWVVVDTGSTDGTQDVIRKAMEGVPGEVYDRPWRGFGKSRTEAFDLAQGKADYALVIDADDVLQIPEGFTLPPLEHDVYRLDIHLGALRYKRPQLFSLEKPWQYVGVMHEYAHCDEPVTRGEIEGLVYKCTHDGARSKDPEKYRHDAEVLEQGMKDEPENPRYVFYAAQSWRDVPDDHRARELYLKRGAMGGFPEEVFCALVEAARAAHRLGEPWETVLGAYLRAHEHRPTRVEPLYELALYCRLRKEYGLAWLFSDAGARIRFPTEDVLFVPSDVYAWRIHDEHSLAAFYTGRLELSREINERLLADPRVPAEQHARLRDNIGWADKALAAKKT